MNIPFFYSLIPLLPSHLLDLFKDFLLSGQQGMKLSNETGTEKGNSSQGLELFPLVLRTELSIVSTQEKKM